MAETDASPRRVCTHLGRCFRIAGDADTRLPIIPHIYSRTTEDYGQHICSATKFQNQMNYPSRPPGITALCFFFLFGTVMSGLAAVMLLFPGSATRTTLAAEPSRPRRRRSKCVWQPWPNGTLNH